MADFREMTVDRGKNTAIVKFRERQKGLTVAGKIVMPAPVFNKYLSEAAFHKYHVSNFHAVYPSRHGDAREYCGGYKGYKIIIWQKKNPPGSPFYVTIKKGKREAHLISTTLAASLKDSTGMINYNAKHRMKLVSS